VEFVVPPEDIQRNLVKTIARAFAALDHNLLEAARAASLVERLDQATLAKAFRGDLV
jgi:type I restriction enzyme S subunit